MLTEGQIVLIGLTCSLVLLVLVLALIYCCKSKRVEVVSEGTSAEGTNEPFFASPSEPFFVSPSVRSEAQPTPSERSEAKPNFSSEPSLPFRTEMEDNRAPPIVLSGAPPVYYVPVYVSSDTSSPTAFAGSPYSTGPAPMYYYTNPN